MEAKDGISLNSLKPNILYKAVFVKGDYIVLSKQFLKNCESMFNMVVSQNN